MRDENRIGLMFKGGGPAFPAEYDEFANGRGYYTSHNQGMTLRDYFAAKAMASLLTLANDVNTDALGAIAAAGGIAPYAYQVADAMLKARAQ